MEHSAHKHEHNHTHEQGELHECSCEECTCETKPENFWVDGHLHDEASVVSGECKLYTDYQRVSTVLQTALEDLASTVTEKGGIIGHIKAAVEISSVEMFSITDESVSIKRTKEQDIIVQIAAIVFCLELAEMKTVVQTIVMEKLRALQHE